MDIEQQTDTVSRLTAFLAQARRRLGLTQAELARRAQCTRSVIHAMERGKVTPSLPMMARIGWQLGYRLAWLPRDAMAALPVEAVRLETLTPDQLPSVLECIVRAALPAFSVTIQLHPQFPEGDGPLPRRPISVDDQAVTFRFRGGSVVAECQLPVDTKALSALWSQLDSFLENYRAVYRARLFQMLFDAATRLSAERDPTPLLEMAVQRAQEFLRSDLAYVTLMDDSAQQVRMKVAVGHRQSGFLDIVLPIGVGLGGRVARDRQPLTVCDYLNADTIDHDPATDHLVRQEGIRAILGVPLVVRDKALGVLFAARRTPTPFHLADMHILTALGDFAALALDNAESLSQLRQAAEFGYLAQKQAEHARLMLERALQLERDLVRALLASDGFSDALNRLGDGLGIEVLLTDISYRPVAQTARWPYPADTARDVVEWVHHRQLDSGALHAAVRGSPAVVRAVAVVPVQHGNTPMGWIWAVARDTGTDLAAILERLGAAARIFALAQWRRRDGVAAESFSDPQGLWGFLAWPTLSDAAMRQVTAQWPLLSRPHRCLVIHLNTGGVDEHAVQFAQLYQLCRELSPRAVWLRYGQRVVGFSDDLSLASWQAVADTIAQRLAWPNDRMRWLYGDVTRDLSADVRDVRQMATMLDHYGPRLKSWMTPYARLKLVWDLAQGDDDRLRRFVREHLGPLVEQPELMETLAAYFASGRNQMKTAKELGIHLNTLRYRLAKTANLLGQRLDESDKRLGLEVAVTVWQTVTLALSPG